MGSELPGRWWKLSGVSLEEADNEELVFEGDIYPWGFSPHLLLHLLLPPPLFHVPALCFLPPPSLVPPAGTFCLTPSSKATGQLWTEWNLWNYELTQISLFFNWFSLGILSQWRKAETDSMWKTTLCLTDPGFLSSSAEQKAAGRCTGGANLLPSSQGSILASCESLATEVLLDKEKVCSCVVQHALFYMY